MKNKFVSLAITALYLFSTVSCTIVCFKYAPQLGVGSLFLSIAAWFSVKEYILDFLGIK